ncbi:AsmA-like C-terminal region-containing protein [Methylobacterium sp. Leaf118]|uniref:AsmA-like C-terminal region-containing protein n=1 Tax=Methylobacterium sp. Leaf118 TaxID=2876562 RepID=UPI001E3BBC69|nr:AsmA-like C-terminal region-containing protein [Methylobacterium sp. Leaf118]
MSLRRTLPVLGLGGLAAGLIAACLPWSVELPAVSRAVSGGLQASWGVALSTAGPTEIVLLPLPRIVFQDVRLTEGNLEGPVLASGGSLSLQLGLAALLTGRVEVDSLTLDGAEITLPLDEADPRWAGSVEGLADGLADGGPHPRRLMLVRSSVTGRDPRDGSVQTLRDVALTLSWPHWSESVALTGRLTWKGAEVRLALSGLRPLALLTNRTSPFSAHLAWPAGTFSAAGSGSLHEGLRASGSGRLEIRSLARTLAWTGGSVALAPLAEDLTIEGSFEAAAREVQFPNVRVGTAGNVLEGAGSARFGPGRTAVQATLAAESLNLSPLVAELLPLAGVGEADAQAWGTRSLDLARLTGGDLDLRISAAGARVGPLRFTDLACGVMVREHGIEASLGRAALQAGTVKGRVILEADPQDRTVTAVKAQGSVDGLDLGAVMADLGQDRWMLGATRGSLLLEGAGRDAGTLARSISGRIALRSEEGALTGLDLADLLQRGGAPAAGPPGRRNARTPYEQASVSVLFSEGVGEIVEGRIQAAALTASLTGRLTLADRRFEARAELTPRIATDSAPRVTARFDLSGPWDAVSVRPAILARAEDDPIETAAGRLRRPGSDLPMGIRAYVPADP